MDALTMFLLGICLVGAVAALVCIIWFTVLVFRELAED